MSEATEKQKQRAAAIKKEFYDPKTGFWSVDKIHKKLQAKNMNISLDEVKDVLKNQLVNQIFKPMNKPKKKRFTTITAAKPRHQYQMDVLDLKNYTKFNKGFRYLMNVIDVYSRYAYAVPVKTKNETDVVAAFKKVVEVMGKCENLNTDLESSFLGRLFQSYLEQQGIRHWQHNPNDDKRNMAIVERFNRTVREVLTKYFYSRDTKDWLTILPDFITNYNSTFHTTIQEEPIQVWKKEVSSRQKIPVKGWSGEKEFEPKRAIKIGDVVRILKRIDTFSKASTAKKFSKNEYTVIDIEGNTFVVQNEKGVIQRRKGFELQKIDAAKVESPDLGKAGQGKEFKKEVKKAQGARRLAKEDIKSDLVNTAPAREKRERKAVEKYLPQ